MHTFRKIFVALLCLTLLLAGAVTAFAAEEYDAVIYLDQVNGLDTNDGLTEATAVKSVKPAYTALANALDAKGLKTNASAVGKIVLVNDYVYRDFTATSTAKDFGSASHVYRVVFEGKTPQTSLQIYQVTQSFLGMMGPTTFQNINIRLSEECTEYYFSIHGRGGKLIIGEGVTTSENPNYRPILSAGPYFETGAAASLEVNSGDWRALYAGSYHRKLKNSGTLVMNGGTTSQISASMNNNVTGNVNITINGGTIAKVIPTPNAGASVTGNVNITINGGTFTGPVYKNGNGTISGTSTTTVTDDSVVFAGAGDVYLAAITASKLNLGNSTRVIFSKAVTGPVEVNVDKGVRYDFAYVTAPADTADDAFAFTDATVTVVTSGENKIWKNTDNSAFTGLVLKAPKEFTVTLYPGVSGGEAVAANKTETVDGITYRYYNNLLGTYRYITSRSGYYSLTKVVYMSEAESMTETVVDASSGKRDAKGWEPTSVKDYSDEARANIAPDDETALWWKDYSPYLVSPYFTDDTRAEHRATTQQEMEDFIASLDDKDDNMYVYSLGTSSTYGLNLPIVIFTEVDLSGAKTLEEAAALIRADEKLVIHYQAQIHGNEPAGGEAALNQIARMDSAEGTALLERLNVYIIPRVNPDGSKNFTRNDATGTNLNRDMLMATQVETSLIRYAYDLFQPDINLDGHEYTYQPELASGKYNDLMVSSGANGNFSDEYIAMSEAIARNHFDTMFGYGMQPSYYTDNANSYSPATGSGYHSLRGSFHVLLESRGIGGGNYTMARRVTAHLIALESIFGYAYDHHEQIMALVDAERERFATLGATYEEDDVIILQFDKTTRSEELAHASTTWDMAGGTVKSYTTIKPVIYRVPASDTAVRPRPTAYVFPAGEEWTQTVLNCLDEHSLEYYFVDSSRQISLKQLVGKIDAAGLSEETWYSFENGCYVVPMNQSQNLIACYMFEPDICGYDAEEGYGSLTQMDMIPALDNCFPVYHYVHDLEIDGTIATAVGAAAPAGVTGVNPDYIGGTGKITGLDKTKSYAYRNVNTAEYTVVSGVSEITGLGVGTWLVRYADEAGNAYKETAITLTYGDITEVIVYVDAAAGDDTNAGFNEDAPVATIEAAVAALSKVVSADMTGKVVFLADYALGNTAYTFPTHTFPVVYTAKTPDIALIKAGNATQKECAVHLSGPSTFEHMTLTLSGTQSYYVFACNGYKTIMGEGLTCTPNSNSKYIMLAAGGYSKACASTDLTVLSGRWNMIYAGGYQAGVTGDCKLTVKNATLAGQIMATYNGAIGGNISYVIDSVNASGYYLGAATTATISGDVTATLSGKLGGSFLYAGSRDSGNTTGTVTVIVKGADLSEVPLYGTCKSASATVGKSVLVLKSGTLGTYTGFTETKLDSLEPMVAIYCGAAKLGEYPTIADALEELEDGCYLKLLGNTVDDSVVTGTVWLDLAGYTLSGITLEGTLYGMDSATDDYTDASAGKLTCTLGQNGKVMSNCKTAKAVTGKVKRYLTAAEEDSYSFHRFYMSITDMTFRPADGSIGYRAVFAGSNTVKALLAEESAFGYCIGVEGGNPLTLAYGADRFTSLQNMTLEVGGFFRPDYGTEKNAQRAETPIVASLFVKLASGEVIETAQWAYSLRDLVEMADAAFASYTPGRQNTLVTFVATYADITKGWNLVNCR